jgi:hypothetical protein
MAVLQVRWDPILTFTRRRLALLDWLEENVAPLAFTEAPDHVGVAVGSAGQRIRTQRDGLDILLDGASAEVQSLSETIDGVFEQLRPGQAWVSRYRGAWTTPIALEYKEACSRLAHRAFGGFLPEDATPYDCAYLVDLHLPSGKAQIEFGVVTPSEVRERLEDPTIGILATRGDARPLSSSGSIGESGSNFVFFDVSWRPRSEEEMVSGRKQALGVFNTLEADIARLAGTVGSAL